MLPRRSSILSGARPGRINQWNIAIQESSSMICRLRVAYVGNRAVWLQADGMLDLNAMTEDRLASFGLNINNAADRTLLTSAMSSPQVQARGFQLPYQGFPANLTLAQALRPYPQFSSIGTRWASRGNTWYDSLQVKVPSGILTGLTMTGGFTWQKEFVLGALSGWRLANRLRLSTISSIGSRTNTFPGILNRFSSLLALRIKHQRSVKTALSERCCGIGISTGFCATPVGSRSAPPLLRTTSILFYSEAPWRTACRVSRCF